jgi:hypothetical protein
MHYSSDFYPMCKRKNTVTVNGMKTNSNVCPFIPTRCLQTFAFPSSIIEKWKELRRREFENLPCFINEALYYVKELWQHKVIMRSFS